MHYAQLNPDGSYLQDLPDGNVEFGPRHFQPARTLSDAEKAQFFVVALTEIAAPACDPITQAVQRAGAELVGGAWRMKWDVIALDAATVSANQAKEAERLRRAEIELAIKTDAILLAVSNMTKAQYDTWWSARTAAQKDKMLQLLFLAHANKAG